MHRDLQFGMRENPASDRRHGSRQGVRSPSDGKWIQEESLASSLLTHSGNSSSADVDSAPNAAPLRAATVEKIGEHIEKSSQLLPPGNVLGRAQTFEPLLGSLDAAKLLGNIHVKTLQRYARRGNLPGYQIGGHSYFRASELDSWLRSQINSSCHPCRLPKEAK